MATRYIERNADRPNPAADTAGNVAAIRVDSDDEQLKFYDFTNSTELDVVTETQTQTLTNKMLTAPTLTSPTISGVITNSAVENGPAPVPFTAGTALNLTAALHAGKVVYVTDVACDYRLPAATGTGNKYTVVLGATQTGASTIKVNATPGTDTMIGNAVLFNDSAVTTEGYTAGATADTIDLLGTSNSTGGMIGALYEFIDIASGLWHVNIVSDAGGTEATPFSATVP